MWWTLLYDVSATLANSAVACMTSLLAMPHFCFIVSRIWRPRGSVRDPLLFLRLPMLTLLFLLPPCDVNLRSGMISYLLDCQYRSSQSRREKILIITTNYLCRRNIKKAAASCWRLTTVRSARRRCSRFSSLVASSCHVKHNCTIFLCCLDDKMERWSMQRSQQKWERSSSWVTIRDAQNAKRVELYTFCSCLDTTEAFKCLRNWQNVL